MPHTSHSRRNAGLILSAILLVHVASCTTEHDEVQHNGASSSDVVTTGSASFKAMNNDAQQNTPANAGDDVPESKAPTHFEQCRPSEAETTLVVEIVHRELGSTDWDFAMRPVEPSEDGFRWPYPGGHSFASGHGVTDSGESCTVGGSVILNDSPAPGVDLDLDLYYWIGDDYEIDIDRQVTIPFGTTSSMKIHDDVSLRAKFTAHNEDGH